MEDFPLTVQIGDQEVTLGNVHVQRTSYDVAIKSIIADSTVSAGQSVPVQIVLKNDGYNNLQDLYVTVSIPELGIQKQVYVGDLVTQEYKDSSSSDDNDKVSTMQTVTLDIPSTDKAGKYTLTVTASNDDTTSTATQDLTVTNSITDLAMKSGTDLVLLNPTNQLVVYTIKYNTETDAVIIPAASSKTVAINVPTSGDYKFDVSVYSGDALLDTVNYTGTADTTQVTSPVFVLTVILAIVFLVLLVVLVVLVTKKPQKTEEFGESYY